MSNYQNVPNSYHVANILTFQFRRPSNAMLCIDYRICIDAGSRFWQRAQRSKLASPCICYQTKELETCGQRTTADERAALPIANADVCHSFGFFAAVGTPKHRRQKRTYFMQNLGKTDFRTPTLRCERRCCGKDSVWSLDLGHSVKCLFSLQNIE
jgi:hypothetical protein